MVRPLPAMKQYRVRGIYRESGKECWLTGQGYWGAKKDSILLTKMDAEHFAKEQRTRNIYLDAGDRIDTELEAQ